MTETLQLGFNDRLAIRKSERAKTSDRWAIILAGGDGTRLRSLTRTITGDDRPKQFCPILRNETLLDQTRRRVSLAIDADQTLLSLTETHKEFYQPLVADLPAGNLVVQPSNLGTGPAILYSLLRLLKMAPSATVAFFPSDHYFADDQTFMSHVDAAFRAVKARPEMLVLLGIEADRPEVEYGWIEPAPSILAPLGGAISRVRRFWEKPSKNVAQALMDQGFLWNSFVMVGRVDAFLLMIQRAAPRLYGAFETVIPSLGTKSEYEAIHTLYSSIQPSNFSHEVLSVRAEDLSVLPVRNVGWSDWGDPGRVLTTLAGM
ncbi:MAG TPA: sugar phosphate nucleotidyltransferase, partial [Pyrinomonadaceae bacterium]